MDWRMTVAHVWDWLFRRSCWAETAAWAMGYEGCRLRMRMRRGGKGYCPDGVKKYPGCWCGKFRYCPERNK